MSEEISKKELLEKTGISYGQLYRWKREGLIPEEWFVKRSSYTGQETFFPRDKVLARVKIILEQKDNCSLETIRKRIASGSEKIYDATEALSALLDGKAPAGLLDSLGEVRMTLEQWAIVASVCHAALEAGIGLEDILALGGVAAREAAGFSAAIAQISLFKRNQEYLIVASEQVSLQLVFEAELLSLVQTADLLEAARAKNPRLLD